MEGFYRLIQVFAETLHMPKWPKSRIHLHTRVPGDPNANPNGTEICIPLCHMSQFSVKEIMKDSEEALIKRNRKIAVWILKSCVWETEFMS